MKLFNLIIFPTMVNLVPMCYYVVYYLHTPVLVSDGAVVRTVGRDLTIQIS